MKLALLLKKNGSAYIISAVMIAILISPILSLPLGSDQSATAAAEQTVMMDSQIDYEPVDSYFDPADYDVKNYVRDDMTLNNRGSASEDLLFGSVETASGETAVTPPPDMTFKEDSATVYILATELNMREYPTVTSPVIQKYTWSQSLKRTGIGEEWDRVVNAAGVTGYIKAEYISTSKPIPSPTPTKAVSKKKTITKTPVTSSVGQAIAAQVKKYIGIRYRGGYADPSSGFDCSGLTWYVFNLYGIDTPRGTSSYYGAGTVISYSNIQPGDVIAWDTRKYDGRTTITHVGVYVGNGMMVHASSSNSRVTTVSVAQYKAWGCKLISVHRFYK